MLVTNGLAERMVDSSAGGVWCLSAAASAARALDLTVTFSTVYMRVLCSLFQRCLHASATLLAAEWLPCRPKRASDKCVRFPSTLKPNQRERPRRYLAASMLRRVLEKYTRTSVHTIQVHTFYPTYWCPYVNGVYTK